MHLLFCAAGDVVLVGSQQGAFVEGDIVAAEFLPTPDFSFQGARSKSWQHGKKTLRIPRRCDRALKMGQNMYNSVTIRQKIS
jgi:hypothetical protein